MMDFKRLLTPKKIDILWMFVLILTSILMSTVLRVLFSTSISQAFSGVISGLVFMIISFIVPNSMFVPILFLLSEFLIIRSADYFIEDKRIRIPVLVIAVEIIFFFVLNMYI